MQRYTLSRNGQTYGPYSMDELQRYLASGHILLTDLARADDAADWMPVSQLLAGMSSGPGAAAPGAPAYGAPGYGAPAYGTVPAVGYMPPAGFGPFPDPPNLHWALVLLLDLFTCSLFQMVWNIVLAAWFHRVMPASRALWLYIAAAVLILAQAVSGQALGLVSGRHGWGGYAGIGATAAMVHGGDVAGYGLLALICWVVRLIARFTFRAELERHYNTVEPLALSINPVLTFFFGGIYLQSVLNEVNRRKQYARMGTPPSFQPGPYVPRQ